MMIQTGAKTRTGYLKSRTRHLQVGVSSLSAIARPVLNKIFGDT